MKVTSRELSELEVTVTMTEEEFQLVVITLGSISPVDLEKEAMEYFDIEVNGSKIHDIYDELLEVGESLDVLKGRF